VDLSALVVEALFLVLFVATLIEYLRHRDPVRRDVTLVFSGLAVLFVLQVWRGLTGGVPVPVTIAGGLLLLLQPVFALHLASLVRGVARPILFSAVALIVVSIVAAATVARGPLASVIALGSFIGVEALAAAYLLVEARRRRGPAAVRMATAAISTGLLAAAFLFAAGGAVGPDVRAATTPVATGLALLAALGYIVAFLPPPAIRRIWQSSATVAYGQRLIEGSAGSVESIWQGLADFASTMSAGAAAVIVRTDAGGLEVAASGMPRESTAVGGDELDALVSGAGGPEVEVASAGPLASRLAERSGARFVSAVALTVPGGGPAAVLVVLNRYQSLFHGSDLELLGALGAQTALMAERRAIVADQEQLAQRLAATVEALRAAAAAKSDFLASMSHELRTPLSAILGFSDLMRHEAHSGETVSVPLEWVEHIHAGGSHLLTLINDVLDLAKVEAGRLDLHPEPVDLAGAMAESVSGLRPLAERKHLRVEVNATALTATVDRGRFRQIMYNLLSNAIKYTPDGGTISVNAVGTATQVQVAVADSGIGIALADQPHVFEEFRQVGDPSTREPGTGLGLALTRRLVEAHGGTIELESVLGRGSRFMVSLPVGIASAAGVPVTGGIPAAGVPGAEIPAAEVPVDGHQQPVGARRAPGLDLLLVEDDPSAVRLLREYVERSGYQLRVAGDGESALEMAHAQRPDAVLLDVLLPGVDGWEVLRRLKADVQLGDVPVVIVTVVDEREVGMALGAVDYLLKPIRRERLLAVLARVTGAAAAAREGATVLAVDDEPAGVELVRAALAPSGYRVVAASGGREALDRLRNERIDVVVCDLVMPEMDGFAVIKAMRNDPRTADIPIVVCTAHDISDADRERLKGQILGVVDKGTDARIGLHDWLGRTAAALGREVTANPLDA
jgi:signal transduction histidine kinase/CheY-like chemotaxis protein